MNVGLPATGIGGIFYLISAFGMLINELIVTFKGKSSFKRWLSAIKSSGIALGIIISIWLTGVVLSLAYPHHINLILPEAKIGIDFTHYLRTIMASPFVTLSSVLIVAGVSGLVLARKQSKG